MVYSCNNLILIFLYIGTTCANLTLWALRAAGSGTGVVGCGDPCRVRTWVEREKNNPFWRKLNELSENVSFDSEFALAFEIQPFKFPFFVFFKWQFFKVFSGGMGYACHEDFQWKLVYKNVRKMFGYIAFM